MNYKNLIILGCPRSGTSLIANLLNNSGYDVDCKGTKKLMKKNENYNPDGYFERIDIVKLNDQLIRLYDKNHNFLNPPNNNNILNEELINLYKNKTIYPLQDISLEHHIENYVGLNNKIDLLSSKEKVENEMNSYNGWLIKDSRMCYTLNLWDFKNINIIKIVRNKNEVKQSMINHYGNLFDENIVFFKNQLKKVDFDKYYDDTNNLIDTYINKYGGIEIKFNDLKNKNFTVIEKYLGVKLNENVVKTEYIKY